MSGRQPTREIHTYIYYLPSAAMPINVDCGISGCVCITELVDSVCSGHAINTNGSLENSTKTQYFIRVLGNITSLLLYCHECRRHE